MRAESKKWRVVYVARFIPFYRGGVLAQLARRFDCAFICQDKEFGVGATPELPELKKLPMTSFFKKWDWLPMRREIGLFQPDVVVSELGLSFLTVFWLVLAKRVFGYKLIFWTHGLEGPRKAGRMWKSDYLRKFLLERAEAVIYYTEGCAKASSGYLQRPLTFVAPNTLDSRSLDNAWHALLAAGIHFEKSVVFIGRLVESKRVTELLELAALLQERGSLVRVKIAGEGPQKAEMEREVARRNLPVDFVGAVTSDSDKASLLGSALAGVCLGRVGLNIVDNMSFGLPLLTLDAQPLSSAHAPEIDYLVEDVTGRRCQDLDEVAREILRLEADASLRVQYQKTCRAYFETHCSMERQLAGLTEAVKGAVK